MSSPRETWSLTLHSLAPLARTRSPRPRPGDRARGARVADASVSSCCRGDGTPSRRGVSERAAGERPRAKRVQPAGKADRRPEGPRRTGLLRGRRSRCLERQLAAEPVLAANRRAIGRSRRRSRWVSPRHRSRSIRLGGGPHFAFGATARWSPRRRDHSPTGDLCSPCSTGVGGSDHAARSRPRTYAKGVAGQ